MSSPLTCFLLLKCQLVPVAFFFLTQGHYFAAVFTEPHSRARNLWYVFIRGFAIHSKTNYVTVSCDKTHSKCIHCTSVCYFNVLCVHFVIWNVSGLFHNLCSPHVDDNVFCFWRGSTSCLSVFQKVQLHPYFRVGGKKSRPCLDPRCQDFRER